MKNVRPKQACGLLRRIFGVGARARSSRPARKLMLAALVLAVATFEVVPAVATAQQDDGAISALTLTSDTPGTLDVSWEAPTGAAPTDYRVNWARSGEDYPPWTDNTANHQPTTTSQQLTDLDEDVEYKVRVRARYHDGPWSGPWAEATRQVAAQPVVQAQQDDGAISALTLTSDTPGTLDVSWDAPTGAAPTDYRVNWARSGEDYPPWTDNTANLHPTTTSQQLTDLDEDVEYKVRVRARYHDGPWSGPWAEATRQVAAQPVVQAQQDDGAISALTLTSDTPGTLDVSWDAPTGAAPTDYRVNWARSGEDYPPWTDNTANLHPTTTSQQLTDLDEDVEYKVRVRARYHDGPWSGPWAEATRQVVAQPSLGVRSADDPPVTLEPPKLTVIEPDEPDDPLVALQQSTDGPVIELDTDDPDDPPTTQDTPPTVTTPQRVPRSTPRSDTPSKSAPIRTITEGQSTTFAPPVPADRQNIRGCVTSIPENSFFAAGGCYQRSNGDVEYRHYFDSGHSSTTVFGVCSGPYTLEILTRDSRVQTSGNQIRVTTTPAGQDTDDAGTVQVAYLLHGTRTVTHVQIDGSQSTTFDTASCSLIPDPVTVEVRRGTRPGMTAAVAVYAPSTEYLSTPSTVTWECTQVLVDAGVQCALNSVISTTTQPTFPTPRGCRIVVTVSENRPGHGSTNCLTSDGIAAYEDTINNGEPEDEWLDVDSLPPCPLSTAPADLEALDLDSSGRKRCVATN